MGNVIRLHGERTVEVTPAVAEDIDYGIEVGIPLLADSIERDGRNVPLERVLANIRERRSVVWLVYIDGELVASILTAVMQHPLRATLYIEHLGGTRIREWMSAAMEALVDLARKAELDGIEADGRPGFDKFLGQCGDFERKFVHYEMEL